MTIRIVLVDDHPIVLDGLACVLQIEPDMEVLARCTGGEQALREVREKRPDVIVLDLVMAGMDGLRVLEQLHAEQLPGRVVMLAAAIGDEQVARAIRLGAKGFVLKAMASEFIVKSIRKVHAGGLWLETGSIGAAIGRLLQGEPRAQEILRLLSGREQAVLRLLVSGLRNHEIAARLFISEGTVKTHVHKIYEKLNVKSRLEVAAYARARGFV